ncbi:hypothetical protein JCM3775_002870 [Rhodotorula graminis]|uniref:Enoyl reductase (ER) domain-containing protein n=1 Tax=Rhodotorula graminis (strain WP1) TaxID=578459 RepID=A0A0P9H1Z0_RHOGW|nr:uncharacterized protein RHOBADRAFT_16529 [Rhodotorula graminis WP1]KPV74028.1 hypothetical protein RHOBADRAFT_16529 [Rhodotorula graminis WP1]
MAPLPSTLPRTYSRITLRERPKAAINPSLDGKTGTFTLETGVPMFGDDELKPGEVIVQVDWISVDPAMRGWLNPTRSYVPPVAIGATMRAAGVGRVVRLAEGDKGELAVGDWVVGTLNWTQYAKVPVKEVQKIQVDSTISPTLYLGALGMTGQTAYWGLHDVAQIQPGDTVVVTGAAGAVGSIACQLAKLHGCRVVAIAGGEAKCKWLKDELLPEDQHVVLDYKSADFKKNFRDVGYVDKVFENVGGEILDLILTRLNKYARIALCGAIADYQSAQPKGLQMYLTLISQSATIQGFIVFNYSQKYHVAAEEMAKHIRSGALKVRETRTEGIDQCVNALVGLFSGANTGKSLVKIGDEGAPKL